MLSEEGENRKKMKKSNLILALSMLSFWVGAQTVSTPVVGFLKISLPAGKASMVSFPLNKSSVASGSITSMSGNVLSTSADLSGISGNIINALGEPAYYLEVNSGSNQGMILDVTAKGTGSLTVQDASLLTGNESFKVVKYTTIADIFGANNSAGLTGGPSVSDADVIWIVSNGSFNQYYFSDDGFGGDGDPLQWAKPGLGAVDASVARIDPDQGILVIRKAGSAKDVTITGTVRSNPSYVPFITGTQIITNPYPVDRTLASLGLKTGDERTGLREGANGDSADLIWKISNGTWQPFYVYNDGFGGDGDPIAWTTPGSSVDQGSVQIAAGEALLVIRKANAFNWTPTKPTM